MSTNTDQDGYYSHSESDSKSDEPRYTDLPHQDGDTNHQHSLEHQQEENTPAREEKEAVVDFQNEEKLERVYDVPYYRKGKKTRNIWCKLLVLLLILVVCAVAATALSLSIYNRNEIEALKKENAVLRGVGMAQSYEMVTNNSCSNIISDFNDSSIVPLLSRISDIEANITALSSQTVINKADISALQNSLVFAITNLEGNISDLATDLKSDHSRLQLELNTLSLKTGSLVVNVSTLYSILSSAMEEVQGNFSALNTEIDSLDLSIARLTENMSMFHSELVLFAERLTHLNSTVTNSLPTSLLMEVSQIQESLNALKSKTTDLERNFDRRLSSFHNQINSLEIAQTSSEQEIKISLAEYRNALIGVGVAITVAIVAFLCSCCIVCYLCNKE